MCRNQDASRGSPTQTELSDTEYFQPSAEISSADAALVTPRYLNMPFSKLMALDPPTGVELSEDCWGDDTALTPPRRIA